MFIYVKDNYQTVGLLNLFTNLSTILFSYLYGKKINKEKNFLGLSIFFVFVVYVLKLNFSSYLLLLISFLEGIVTKMYEISSQKEFYSLSKKFEYQSYNCVYEITQNLFRTIMVGFLFFFIDDLKVMILMVLLVILSWIFIKFKKISINDYKK